jgi:protein-L-isoaspartate(D-aspartate) O-methyltransferase
MMNLETARQQMIGQQLRAWDVSDARVLDAVQTVPREIFVPPEWRTMAYADTELPLGHGVQLAPPKIQGRALQILLPRPDDKALEIGCGTGYLTACLARLAGRVTGVEIQPELAATARRNLAALAIENAEILEGDGLDMSFGDRYDVICVNGSMPGPIERFERLLEIGGRLFVVTGRPPIMQARRITRVDESEWTRESVFETCLPPLENARPPAEFVF